MELLKGISHRIKSDKGRISKTMLTCFVSNKHALDFYFKHGFSYDPENIEPVDLGDGKLTPDYAILSLATALE
jgi:hypothetical protein